MLRNAVKCWLNAGNFFPDVVEAKKLMYIILLKTVLAAAIPTVVITLGLLGI